MKTKKTYKQVLDALADKCGIPHGSFDSSISPTHYSPDQIKKYEELVNEATKVVQACIARYEKGFEIEFPRMKKRGKKRKKA